MKSWCFAVGKNNNNQRFGLYIFFLRRDKRHAFASSYLLYSGSIFWFFLNIDSFELSPILKKDGANSISHFGSITVTLKIVNEYDLK